ncbi:MAG: hypothetical protein M1429_01285 [Patescibacteria group bacterium]|nr:hypothetical protein [Patescibacteria group bacterium]
MKFKWFFISIIVLMLSAGTTLVVSAQTPAATDLTNPTTDFGRDVKNGIESTKNDSVAIKQQKDAKDNELEDGNEDNKKVEVEDATETLDTQETPDVSETPDVKNSSGEIKNGTESSSPSGDSEKNTSTPSAETTGGSNGEQ